MHLSVCVCERQQKNQNQRRKTGKEYKQEILRKGYG